MSDDATHDQELDYKYLFSLEQVFWINDNPRNMLAVRAVAKAKQIAVLEARLEMLRDEFKPLDKEIEKRAEKRANGQSQMCKLPPSRA